MTENSKDVDRLVAEAEEGYDVDEIITRRAGRPSMGSGPSTIESVRLSPELKRDLLVRAAERGISFSETIREALTAYVSAS